MPHQVDHILAKKHFGPLTLDNTCLACARCNGAKGTNVAAYDPITAALVPLFDPRQDVWDDHFFWISAILEGKTPIGRTTIQVLNINALERVELREHLIEAGLFPPDR
jgi:hypothetical protein